jgi:hypothetical protein
MPHAPWCTDHCTAGANPVIATAVGVPTCDTGVKVGYVSSLVRCWKMPHSPKHSTQRTAAISPPPATAAPADSASTAAFRHSGPAKPARGRRRRVGGGGVDVGEVGSWLACT